MANLTRLTNWPTLLAKEIEAHRTTPFEYGRHDCFLFALRCVRAMTGSDLSSGFVYSNEAEAETIVAAHGGYAAGLTELFESEPMHISRCGRGDIVMATLPEGMSTNAGQLIVGVLDTNRIWFPDYTRLRILPVRRADFGWRIG